MLSADDFVNEFKRYALNVDSDCILGCAACCLGNKKTITKNDIKKISSFLKSNNVKISSLNNNLADLISGDCSFFGLGCSINECKPEVCKTSFNNCSKKESKKLILSKGHDFKELELINIKNYLAESNKLIVDLQTSDFNEVSNRIISMAYCLSDFFNDYSIKPLSGLGLFNLYESLVKHRKDSLECFNELFNKVEILSIKYSETPGILSSYSSELKNIFKQLFDKKVLKEGYYRIIQDSISCTIKFVKDSYKMVVKLINSGCANLPSSIKHSINLGKDPNELLGEYSDLKTDLLNLKKMFKKAYADYSLKVKAADQAMLINLF